MFLEVTEVTYRRTNTCKASSRQRRCQGLGQPRCERSWCLSCSPSHLWDWKIHNFTSSIIVYYFYPSFACVTLAYARSFHISF